MPFKNEYVSNDDAIQFNLDVIFRSLNKPEQIRYQWTIDRSRSVFLMWIERGREEFSGQQTFCFYWAGKPLTVYLESRGLGEIDGNTSTHWSLLSMELPDGLLNDRAIILADLKEALTEYKVSGIGVPVASHFASFDF